MPILPSGVLGFGIASRQVRAVDFAMVAHVGFGDTAPFLLTLRFADIAWGKVYPRPQSLVVDAAREFAAWMQEQVASIAANASIVICRANAGRVMVCRPIGS